MYQDELAIDIWEGEGGALGPQQNNTEPSWDTTGIPDALAGRRTEPAGLDLERTGLILTNRVRR
jgi:hypothetical protein